MPGEYDKLEQELDAILAKAAPVDDDDARIEAAADGAELPHGNDDDDEDDEGAAGGASFMKSFRVKLESGEEADAYDATLMVKAMHAQATRQAATIADLQAQLAGANKVLGKLPEMMKSLTAQIAEQGALIKALREAPGGRQSVTTAPATGTPGKASRGDILAKALDAQRAGRIGGHDVGVIETRLNRGEPIPDHLARAITAA